MNGHNRLIRRNHTYYLRARIPTHLTYLIHKAQFYYSLQTNNYKQALAKLSKESHKVDIKINLLKSIDMRIKNKQLLYDPEDIDKLVIFKLKQIEDIFENYYEEISEPEFDYNNLLIFNKEIPTATTPKEKEIECVELFIKEYFNDLKEDDRTHKSIVKMIGRIDKEEIPLIADKLSPNDDIKKIKTALKGIDKYIVNKVQSIINDEGNNFNINGRVERCLKIIHDEKNQKATSPTNYTHWKKVFEEYAIQKQNDRVTQNSINQNYACLDTIFEIIGKKYVESITYKDCQLVAKKIYNLPKKWKERYRGKNLKDILSTPNVDAISLTTVKRYLRVFKEFMAFCQINRYTTDNFQGDIRITRKKEAVSIEPFTKEELKKIFDPKTYPRVINLKYSYRYWIPLIALYSGMRLNEICQLYVDDIKIEKGVCYFYISDEREDQHLKNPQSHRFVPIHPKLLDLGILEYSNKVKSRGENRLFYQLNYSQKNHYIQAMSHWFRRYQLSLEIKSNSKVFHSFRHLVKQYMTICDIPREHQNRICGWSGLDTGERCYGGNIPISRLNEEISKLKYDFLDKTIEQLKKKNPIITK